MYDNELEYWVRIKESGKRKQKTSYEEVTKKQKGVALNASIDVLD